ncbi:hypothetical protein [Fodinicola acaciae]|uniref:hypothetical protein n=1 Tax=Fodinicola acaciae TaxID=2681555 RepID=UPI001C9E7E06|nr:hypothetical protein [Fodinicola acaciae]
MARWPATFRRRGWQLSSRACTTVAWWTRQTRERIETLTEELAAPAYDVLSADELVAGLVPIAIRR